MHSQYKQFRKSTIINLHSFHLLLGYDAMLERLALEGHWPSAVIEKVYKQ